MGTDDEAGGRLAAEHLLSLGHRRVAHIAGSDLVSTSRRRRRGFEETIRAGGGTCVSLEDPSFGRFESVSGEIDVATQLLNTTPRPTAVFAVNDYMAAAVYDAAAERGLRIPDDLSVVGFADLKHVRLLRPTLTTIRQCPEEIGREAAQLVLGRLDGKFDRAPQKRLLPVTLVSRASTAPPAST